jgi:hypothetical protein
MRTGTADGLLPVRLCLILVLGCVVFSTGRAVAQMLPMIPDPLASEDLDAYADMLELSDQQRLSMLTMHARYRDRYDRFTDGDLTEFQDRLLDIGMRFIPGRFQIPERGELEELVEQYQRVIDRMWAIDRSFLDGLVEVVSDEQAARLPRVRRARELAVYRGVAMEFVEEMNPGAAVDLTSIMREMDLTASEEQRIDPLLTTYEAALLRETKDLYGILIDLSTVILDTIDALGLREMTPEQIIAHIQDEQVQQSLRATFDEQSKPFQAAAHDLSSLNLRTFGQLAAALDDEHQDRLRDAYYGRAYREVYRGEPAWRERFRAALELPDLSEEQRQALESQRDSSVGQQKQLMEQMVELLESDRTYRTTTRFSGEEPDPNEERIASLRERYREIGETAASALEAILGPDLLTQLDGPSPDAATDSGSSRVATATTGEAKPPQATAPGSETAAQEREAIARLLAPRDLPEPISVGEFDQLTGLLGWDAEQQSLLSTLYDDYRSSFEQARQSPPIELSEVDGEPTPGQRARARTSAFDALSQIDAKLFDDATMFASGDQDRWLIDQFHHVRQRSTATTIAERASWRWRGVEGYVDLAGTVLSSGADASTIRALEPIISSYIEQTTPLINQRLEAARETRKREEMSRSLRERGDPAAVRLADSMSERSTEARRSMEALTRQIAELNRQILPQLLDRVPDDLAWRLRTAYFREAYPRVFDDDEAADDVIAKVLREVNLSAGQRDRINDLAAGYRSRYFEISDRMIDLRRAFDQGTMEFSFPERQDIERQIELERLRFHRRELNRRTKLHLRLLLEPSQRELVPQLVRRVRAE